MAECPCCKREMLTSEGCAFTHITINGKDYERERWKGPGRCPDCAAAPGGYHHPCCDQEKCPRCGWQMLSCECDIEDLFRWE